MMTGYQRNFKNTEIQLFSGEAYDYVDPSGHNMSLYDITKSLSLICRYNGHSQKHYSVAQHSCMVGDMMTIDGCTKEEILYGYTHDFGESVYCDLPQPLKVFFRGSDLLNSYTNIEEDFIYRVYRNLGMELPSEETKKKVKKYDILSLEFEMANILSNKIYGHEFIVIDDKKLNNIEAFSPEYKKYIVVLEKIFDCNEKDFAYSQDVDWAKELENKVENICKKF